ncbi:MAG: hypothetical protein ACRD2E_12030 [Terriglobales bacterium]
MTHEELQQARQRRCPSLGPGGVGEFVAAVGFATFAHAPEWGLPALEAMVAPELLPVIAAELEALIAARQICEVRALGPALVYLPPELLADAYLCRAGRLPASRRDQPATAGRPALPPSLPAASPLARQVAALLWASPPLTAGQLRDAVGPQRTSILAILAAGGELARALQIVRVGGSVADPLWTPVSVAFPAARAALDHSPRDHAAAALLSKLLWLLVTATEDDLAAFFGPLFSRSRLRGLLAALEAAGVVLGASLDGRPGFQIAPGR